jgi:hypothetical protein
MSSPFGFLQNATLSIPVTTDAMGVDPTTGNVLPQTEILLVKAYLKPDRRPRGIFYPGIDETEEPMKGYSVEPQQLPDTVKSYTKVEAVISGIKGIFTLILPTPEPTAPIVNPVTGIPITGLFKRQV